MMKRAYKNKNIRQINISVLLTFYINVDGSSNNIILSLSIYKIHNSWHFLLEYKNSQVWCPDIKRDNAQITNATI